VISVTRSGKLKTRNTTAPLEADHWVAHKLIRSGLLVHAL
jgi:hypothetical protein